MNAFENLDKFSSNDANKFKNYIPNHNGYETSNWQTVFYTDVRFVGDFDNVDFYNDDHDPHNYYMDDGYENIDGYSTDGYSTDGYSTDGYSTDGYSTD